MALPVDLQGMAILHAGPIVSKDGDGWKMISIGPTTSMRMEGFEREFIGQTGVKLIIGKGGMGPGTVAGCSEHKAVHAVFPGGCAVLAATEVEAIERVEWLDLGMPEALWVCRVRQFGPLIISINTKGNNLFETNKAIFDEKKGPIVREISSQVRFIKSGEPAMAWKRIAATLIPIALWMLLLALPAPHGLAPAGWRYFALFSAVIVGLILEPVPGSVIGLMGISVAAALNLVAATPAESVKWALSGFSNSTVWLIFVAFMFGLGYEKTGLGRRIALNLVRLLGRSTLGLGYAVALSDLCLGPFMPSNTARSGGTIYPIIKNIPEIFGSYPGETSRKMGAYLMWTGMAACAVTSSMFLTANAPNLLGWNWSARPPTSPSAGASGSSASSRSGGALHGRAAPHLCPVPARDQVQRRGRFMGVAGTCKMGKMTRKGMTMARPRGDRPGPVDLRRRPAGFDHHRLPGLGDDDAHRGHQLE